MTLEQRKTPRAHIAWLSADRAAFQSAAPQFAAAGYLLAEIEETARAEIAVVDFRARRVSATAASRLAALVRRKTPECGIVYLAPPFLGAAERAHLRRSGDLVLCEDDLRPVVEACRQRLRIRNIAEETGERLKSVASLNRLSDFPPIEASSAAPVRARRWRARPGRARGARRSRARKRAMHRRSDGGPGDARA